jgi:hypothetical protein
MQSFLRNTVKILFDLASAASQLEVLTAPVRRLPLGLYLLLAKEKPFAL